MDPPPQRVDQLLVMLERSRLPANATTKTALRPWKAPNQSELEVPSEPSTTWTATTTRSSALGRSSRRLTTETRNARSTAIARARGVQKLCPRQRVPPAIRVDRVSPVDRGLGCLGWLCASGFESGRLDV